LILERALWNSPYKDDPSYIERLKKYFENSIKQGISEADLNSGRFSPSLYNDKYNLQDKNKYNEALSRSTRFHLKFDLNKVKYVILKSDKEINLLLNAIKKLQYKQPSKFTDSSINLLATKIITCKQINEDF